MPGEGQGLLALAQSTAIARAMASICNDERATLGVTSGHGPAASSPLQGASARASADRYAGEQHAARIPCSTLASAPQCGPLGCVQLRFLG